MDSKYTSIENGNKSGNYSGNSYASNGFQIKRKTFNGDGPNVNQPNLIKRNKIHETNNIRNGEINSDNNQNGVKSLIEQRKILPVYNVRKELIELVLCNSTLIIIGETGSGKTTQIPQFLYEYEMTSMGAIAITQPRRVAAITIAKRVSQEMGCKLGTNVGYSVRFEDVTSNQTKIKYMTDGSLLREALCDRLLKNYRIVILDEAHERTINTDVLFGIVKEAQKLRYEKKMIPLKIIIMSATMDVDHFQNYFNNCKVIYLEGRLYPIHVMNTKVSQNDYMIACMSTLFEIHKTAPPNHDILMFLTGQDEIETMASQIRSISKSNQISGPMLRVFPLYAQLAQHRQLEVFMQLPQGTRKVVIATNIAETSLTINGIRYVIDCGMIKRRMHDPVTGMDSLKVVKISQAQADQRAGRAGRESEGYCYRTYTLQEYNNLPQNSIPEILRSNISSAVLQLLALGIDSQKFDFMDKPSKASIDYSMKLLRTLGVVTQQNTTELTSIGIKMSKFPLDPRFSKMLLMSKTYNCVEEILSIISSLSSDNFFLNPIEKRDEAISAHMKFESKYGDHLTLLNVYRAFEKTDKPKVWCNDNFLNFRNLNYARSIRNQLIEICCRYDINLISCENNLDSVRKCLLSGLFLNIAELQRENHYLTNSSRQRAKIHPKSVYHTKMRPQFIIFDEMVSTGRNYLRTVTAIESEWIDDIVPKIDS